MLYFQMYKMWSKLSLNWSIKIKNHTRFKFSQSSVPVFSTQWLFLMFTPLSGSPILSSDTFTSVMHFGSPPVCHWTWNLSGPSGEQMCWRGQKTFHCTACQHTIVQVTVQVIFYWMFSAWLPQNVKQSSLLVTQWRTNSWCIHLWILTRWRARSWSHS